jgi:hypothetical protein
MTSPAFHRYVGIDYSGAETPDFRKPINWNRIGRLSSTIFISIGLLMPNTPTSISLKPNMLPGEYHVARVEGWILGVM